MLHDFSLKQILIFDLFSTQNGYSRVAEGKQSNSMLPITELESVHL